MSSKCSVCLVNAVVGAFGLLSASPAAVAVTPTPSTVITAPVGVMATPDPSTGNVLLAWYSVKGATGYAVSRSNNATQTPTVIATLSSTSLGYRDKQISSAGTYYYQVAAIAADGTRVQSPVVKAVVATPISPPSSQAAVATSVIAPATASPSTTLSSSSAAANTSLSSGTASTSPSSNQPTASSNTSASTTGAPGSAGAARGGMTCPNGNSTLISGRYVDCGDGTLIDTSTQLMWQKAITCGAQTFGNPLCVENQYTWSGASFGTTNINDGTLFTDFLAKLNGVVAGTGGNGLQQLGYYGDWRIPTLAELGSILNTSGCASGTPCIDPVFGPTQAAGYWTSTSWAGQPQPQLAWTVFFSNGDSGGFNKHNYSYCARAVRAGRSSTAAAPAAFGHTAVTSTRTGAASDPYCEVSEIKLLAGVLVPTNWVRADGSLLPISSYTALFSLIGTTYGGDARTTFALPDLRSAAPNPSAGYFMCINGASP